MLKKKSAYLCIMIMLCSLTELRPCQTFIASGLAVIGLGTGFGAGIGFFIKHIVEKKVDKEFSALEQECIAAPTNTKEEHETYSIIKDIIDSDTKNYHKKYPFTSKNHILKCIKRRNLESLNFFLIYEGRIEASQITARRKQSSL